MNTRFKRKLLAALTAPVLGFLIAGTSVAASDKGEAGSRGTSAGDGQRQSSASGNASTQATRQDIRASRLIGMEVQNARGETVGKIDDLVMDVNNQRVYYAVLAHGGVLGVGDKRFAYPVSLFKPGATKDTIVLNVTNEQLERAPGFDTRQWPDWGNDQDRYRGEVERYFGPTVTAKPMPNQRLVRASTLIGKDVNDRQGRDAGQIKDMVINLNNGRVHYAVLETDTNWLRSDRLIPLSLKAFSFPAPRDKEAVLNVASNRINPSQGIEKNRWDNQDLNDPAFRRDIDAVILAIVPTADRPGAAGRAGSERSSEDTSAGSGRGQ